MGVTLEQEMLALSRISVKPQIRIPDRANVKHEVNDKAKLNFGLSPRIFNERFGITQKILTTGHRENAEF